MDIRESALWSEIEDVFDSGEKPVHFRYRCVVHTPEGDLTDVQVISLDVTREYRSAYSDEILIRISIPHSDYIKQLYPHRDQLTITVLKEPLGELSNSDDYDKLMQTDIYRAVLGDMSNPALTGGSKHDIDDKEMERAPYDEIDLQLISRSVEKIRMSSTSGIFVNMYTDDVLQGLLSLSCSGDRLGLDRKESIVGVDVVEGDNRKERYYTIIPQGTPLIKVPDYIQNEQGGVYLYGIGFYIQNRIWYVYPEYQLNRFEEEPRNLTVVNVPNGRFPGAERTYQTDGQRTLVLATGEMVQIDTSESTQLNFGNAVRFARSDLIMGGSRIVDGDEVTMLGDRLMMEVSATPRKTGLNFAPMSGRRITNNLFREVSDLSPRLGTYMQFTWENSDPDRLYPGMPVQYLTMKGEEVTRLYGVVSGCDFSVQMTGTGRNNARHTCTSVVTLFLEKPE